MSRLAYTLTKVTCTNLRAGNLNSLLTLLPITRLWVKCEVFPAHIFAFYSSSFNSYDTMSGLVIQCCPDYSAGWSQYWHTLHAEGCVESTFNFHIRSERHCCDIGLHSLYEPWFFRNNEDLMTYKSLSLVPALLKVHRAAQIVSVHTGISLCLHVMSVLTRSI